VLGDAKHRVGLFLDEMKPDLMISGGLAGALHPHLAIEDVNVQSDNPALATIATEALTFYLCL
jgi:nucleoside phosphorylase